MNNEVGIKIIVYLGRLELRLNFTVDCAMFLKFSNCSGIEFYGWEQLKGNVLELKKNI